MEVLDHVVLHAYKSCCVAQGANVVAGELLLAFPNPPALASYLRTSSCWTFLQVSTNST